MSASKSKAKVTIKTVKSWGFGVGFETETTGEGITYASKIWCETCRRQGAKIKCDPRIRGAAEKAASAYINGTTFITKHNVSRHFGGKVHEIAVEYEKLLGGCRVKPHSGSAAASSGTTSGSQPRIDSALHREATEGYRKLLKTAYELARGGLPLSHFKTLVKIQKENGVRLLQGTDSSDACKEFVSEIAEAIRETVAVLLCNSTAFSVLTDGSQPKKTGSEKELVMVRFEKGGIPCYYVIGLQDIDEYGNPSAANLKKSIDSAFKDTLKLEKERYINVMVGATSDGASVNTGLYNGLLTQFKKERTWLVTVHCVSHRVELALKDSLMKSKEFKDVQDFMIGIYYSMKKSGELKRQLKDFGKIHDVSVYTFPKVHGTRFVGHQRAGVEALLNNWVPLAETLESVCASRKHNNCAKLLGYLKKLKSYNFLCSVCLYKGFLDAITPLSQRFQKGDLFLFEIQNYVDQAKSHITDLMDDDYDHTNPIDCYAGSLLRFDNDSNSVVAKLPELGHTKRKPENREYREIKLSLTGCTGHSTLRHMNKLRSATVPRVNDALCSRFDLNEPNCEILKDMKWIDPANWVADVDVDSEVNSMMNLYRHFQSTLDFANFDSDQKKLKREWRDLRMTVKNFYVGVEGKQMWQNFLT
nr:zinc finger protein 862-like [Lytechinus pictus]